MTHSGTLIAPELLPCPFCRSVASMNYDAGSWGYTPPSATISCVGCGVATPRIYENSVFCIRTGRWTPQNDVRADVAAIWNRRDNHREDTANQS